MTINKKVIVLMVIVVTIVVIGVIGILGSTPNHVSESDAEKTLGDLGYENATIESCEYTEGYNAFNVHLCKLTGTFVMNGTSHTYEFTYFIDGTQTLTKVDGEYVYNVEGSGECTYNYKVVKTLSSITYRGSYGDYIYTDVPDPNMKYVVVDMVAKNVSYNGDLSPTAGGVNCITDANLSYGYDYSATRHYTGKGSFEHPDLSKGGEYSFTLVFEIPEDASIDKIRYPCANLYGWKFDPSLTV